MGHLRCTIRGWWDRSAWIDWWRDGKGLTEVLANLNLSVGGFENETSAVVDSRCLVLGIQTYGLDKRRFQAEVVVLRLGRTRRPSPSCLTFRRREDVKVGKKLDMGSG